MRARRVSSRLVTSPGVVEQQFSPFAEVERELAAIIAIDLLHLLGPTVRETVSVASRRPGPRTARGTRR